MVNPPCIPNLYFVQGDYGVDVKKAVKSGATNENLMHDESAFALLII